jgi:hypothetical protein
MRIYARYRTRLSAIVPGSLNSCTFSVLREGASALLSPSHDGCPDGRLADIVGWLRVDFTVLIVIPRLCRRQRILDLSALAV